MCTGNIHTSQKTRNTGHLGAFDMIASYVATSVTGTLGKHDSPLQTN